MAFISFDGTQRQETAVWLDMDELKLHLESIRRPPVGPCSSFHCSGCNGCQRFVQRLCDGQLFSLDKSCHGEKPEAQRAKSRSRSPARTQPLPTPSRSLYGSRPSFWRKNTRTWPKTTLGHTGIKAELPVDQLDGPHRDAMDPLAGSSPKVEQVTEAKLEEIQSQTEAEVGDFQPATEAKVEDPQSETTLPLDQVKTEDSLDEDSLAQDSTVPPISAEVHSTPISAEALAQENDSLTSLPGQTLLWGEDSVPGTRRDVPACSRALPSTFQSLESTGFMFHVSEHVSWFTTSSSSSGSESLADAGSLDLTRSESLAFVDLTQPEEPQESH